MTDIPNATNETWLSRHQAAEILDISERWLDKISKDGHLTRHQNPLTRRVRYRYDEVIAYRRQRAQ